jgi:hypothetical protein
MAKMKTHQQQLSSDAYRAHEQGQPLPPVSARGHLWKHRNGIWYVLYGYRLKKQVSTRTRDLEVAKAFMANLFPGG